MIRIFGVMLTLLACANANATICTWTGAGADNKLSNADNWDGSFPSAAGEPARPAQVRAIAHLTNDPSRPDFGQ